MATLIYETHSTSTDNELGLASGWYDAELSDTGKRQAVDLGQRYEDVLLSAVYYSDQKRAIQTVGIAFRGVSFALIQDERLRECDYGYLTRNPNKIIGPSRHFYVSKPYPNGESYEQTTQRVRSFLGEIKATHKSGETILVIGNRAVQYGLEHCLKNRPLQDVVRDKFVWQAGWTYEL